MNHKNGIIATCSFLSMVNVVLVSPQAYAQGNIKIAPDKVNTKSPIVYVPFDLIELRAYLVLSGVPSTSLPTTLVGSTIIVFQKITNGITSNETMTAQAYLNEVNIIEKSLNQLGYTLRKGKSEQQEEIIQEDIWNINNLNNQKNSINGDHFDVNIELIGPYLTMRNTIVNQINSSNGSWNPITFKLILQQMGNVPNRPSSPINIKNLKIIIAESADNVPVKAKLSTSGQQSGIFPPNMLNVQTLYSNSWSSPVFGDANKLGAQLNTNISIKGSRSETEINANASVDALVRGSVYSLASASVTLNSYSSQNSKLNVTAKNFLDSNWLNVSYSTDYSYSKNLTKQVSGQKNYDFSIGPVPCTAAIGAKGSVNFNISAIAGHTPSGITAYPNSFGAFLNAKSDAMADIYASVGIGSGKIVSAGVQGNVNLITNSLTNTAYCKLDFDAAKNNKPYIRFAAYTDDDLSMLSGSLSFYVKILWKKFLWLLYNWPGITLHKFLNWYSRDIYLYP